MQSKKLVFFLSFYCLIGGAFSQTHDSIELKKSLKIHLPPWIHNMVYDTASSTKPRFLIYPTVAYSPETLWEFGISSLIVFHHNNDTTLRLSEISMFGFYTQKKQLGLWIDHAIYGRNNKFMTLGKIRFQNYPLSYYGVGSNISDKPLAVVNANYYNVRERFIYRIRNNLFAGLELDYQQINKIDFQWNAGLGSSTPDPLLPKGANGSQNLGIGLGVLIDSRHNILNVRDGYLFEVAYIHYGNLFAQSFPMNTMFFDGRYFLPTIKNQILAFQLVGQFSNGNVPFNQLSLMGGESIMRGYYLGRYRDKNYLATQVEYRFLPFSFSKRLGGVLFGSLGSVSDKFPTQNYKWSAGAGLRYLIFPKKDVFTRIDLGVNPQGYGIYFYIGESF